MTNYSFGSHLSPRSRDARLEATINGAMDYLANEGLTVMGLFKDKAPHADVHRTMVTVMSGKDIDFVTLHKAALATSVLEECLVRVSNPVFPWRLVVPLAQALRQSKLDPPEKQHIGMQKVLLDAVRLNAVSPLFLNLLGLLNLVVKHQSQNGCSLKVAAEAFAPRMLENFGAGLAPDSREYMHSIRTACTVLEELIDKVYVMFPPQNEGSEQQAPAQEPEGGAQVSAAAQQEGLNNPRELAHPDTPQSCAGSIGEYADDILGLWPDNSNAKSRYCSKYKWYTIVNIMWLRGSKYIRACG